MKKIVVLIAALVAVLGFIANAQSLSQSSESVDVLINDIDLRAETIKQLNNLQLDVGAVVSNNNAKVYVQSDTNATTTITQYSPVNGPILYGSQGGSNRVWFATGLTTNDWTVKVHVP